jgi:alpha-N-arabinofuranosidase
MSSYAPLFGNEQGWQWRPNLIWCDNLRSYGTPNYYVQQLFSRNRGDRVLPVQVGLRLPAEKLRPRFYATAARDKKSGEVILKVVNATTESVHAGIQLSGATPTERKATSTLLTAALADENSFAQPRKVVPVTTVLEVSGPRFDYRFRPYSLTVLRVPAGPK